MALCWQRAALAAHTSATDGVRADPLPPPVHCWGLLRSVPGTGAHPEPDTVKIRASTVQESKSSPIQAVRMLLDAANRAWM